MTFCRQIFVAFLLVVPATAGLAAQGGRAPRATSDARAASAGHALKASAGTRRSDHGSAWRRCTRRRRARRSKTLRDSHIGSRDRHG